MSYEQNRKDIESFFVANFSGVSSDKIAWDNSEFTIPLDGSEWVRVSIQNTNSSYVSFGPNSRIRRNGILFVQIFGPENSETVTINQIIDNVTDVFETNLLAGVVFQSPNVNELGVNEGWFQVNVSVPFYFDDIKTKT